MANGVLTSKAAPYSVSYVDWGAIISGALLASAYLFVLLTFGGTAGLSLTSPFELNGSSQTLMLIAVALWLVWVQVSGFALGGYIAGRIRARTPDASEHEVEVGDGIHGLVVWALGVLLGALIAIHAAGSVFGIAAQTGSAVSSGASSFMSGLSTETIVDALFRSDSASGPQASQETRGEAGRIVASAASGGELAEGDRTYLAGLIARNSSLTPDQAQTRVDEVIAEASTAARNAKRATIIIGFIITASLLVSAVAAWWGADVGGDHRDRGLDFSRYGRWRTAGAGGRVKSGGDDLTEIKGIGPALKKQLYDMNIKRFEQIADFSQADIDRVSEELSFPGRIEREDWVGQAKQLAMKK
jgi:hypothetical protein